MAEMDDTSTVKYTAAIAYHLIGITSTPICHCVPVMGQDSGHHGHDLDHRLELAQLAGRDGEPFRSGNGAQAGDEELAADDDHRDPNLDHLGVVGHQLR